MFVLKAFRNKGIAKRALELLHDYVKKHLNMNTLYANISVENDPSIRLFESVGYCEAGLKKNWNFYDNHFHDEYLYQKAL